MMYCILLCIELTSTLIKHDLTIVELYDYRDVYLLIQRPSQKCKNAKTCKRLFHKKKQLLLCY